VNSGSWIKAVGHRVRIHKGLGRACAMQLANEGVHVTLTARGAEALKKRRRIRKAHPGVTVTEIAGDITTPAGREAVLKACPDPDILIIMRAVRAGDFRTGPVTTGSRRSTPTC